VPWGNAINVRTEKRRLRVQGWLVPPKTRLARARYPMVVWVPWRPGVAHLALLAAVLGESPALLAAHGYFVCCHGRQRHGVDGEMSGAARRRSSAARLRNLAERRRSVRSGGQQHEIAVGREQRGALASTRPGGRGEPRRAAMDHTTWDSARRARRSSAAPASLATSKPSLFQCTLMALPHGTSTKRPPRIPPAAARRRFSPVTIVGGSLKVSRNRAVVLRPPAMEMPRGVGPEARSVAASGTTASRHGS